jgi:molybdenum cofactor cytidylyltransferase
LSAAAGHDPVIVLLAAGEGRRFGGIKQLAELSGEPMCRRVAGQLARFGCPLLVVTGAHADAVEQTLAGLKVTTLRNDEWPQGLGSSIACAARHVLRQRTGSGGMLVCLADQPLIDSEHYRRLLERHREAPERLLATAHGEVTGPPVLFSAADVAELAAWQDGRGARALLERESARLERMAVTEYLDVDTPDDLARVRRRLHRPPPD